VGQVPCKFITVRNPGHRNADKRVSGIRLYNLKAGPPPVPQSRFPDFGPSIGTTGVVIRGANMDFTESVTFGGSPSLLTIDSERRVTAIAPPHLAGTVNIVINDLDLVGTTVPGSYVYRPTKPTRVSPVLPFDDSYIVGPGEAVIDAGAHSDDSGGKITGFTVTITGIGLPNDRLPGLNPIVNAFSVNVTAVSWNPNTLPGNYGITFTYRIGNSSAPTDQSLFTTVTQIRTFTR
jgi:hypothetical protein